MSIRTQVRQDLGCRAGFGDYATATAEQDRLNRLFAIIRQGDLAKIGNASAPADSSRR
ncbi:MAG: hypothetical protein R2843_05555 [Thermomicrobiales bacterium]